jgi:hypothetical protein
VISSGLVRGLRLPVGVSTGSDQDVFYAVSRQVPRVELGVRRDEEFGAVIEADAQGAFRADLDGGG